MRTLLLTALTAVLFLVSSCSSGPDPAQDEHGSLEAIRADWEKHMDEFGKLRLQRVAMLPDVLGRFGSAERSDWIESVQVLRTLEQREPGFVYDRVMELLDRATLSDEKGEAARADLARIGQIVRLSSSLDADEPSAWRAARVALEALGSEGVDAAAVRLILKLGSNKPALLAAALEEITALGDGAVRHLCVALSSARVGQLAKERCADALTRIGKPALPALAALLAYPSAPARYNAAKVLGRMADSSILEALLKAEETEKDAYVRCAEIDALGQIGGPEAEKRAVRAIGDEDFSVVKFGARAAARMKARRALPTLVEALEKTANPNLEDVQDELVGALRSITGLRGGGDPQWWRDRLGEAGSTPEKG